MSSSLRQKWYVYILECADKTLYTGITTDITRRMREHNGILQKGAKYTSGKRPVNLKYFERHEDRGKATKREHQIKKLSRQEKEKLCTEFIPEKGTSSLD